MFVITKLLLSHIKFQKNKIDILEGILEEQQEVIADLRKQTKDYYDLLFKGCELK